MHDGNTDEAEGLLREASGLLRGPAYGDDVALAGYEAIEIDALNSPGCQVCPVELAGEDALRDQKARGGVRLCSTVIRNGQSDFERPGLMVRVAGNRLRRGLPISKIPVIRCDSPIWIGGSRTVKFHCERSVLAPDEHGNHCLRGLVGLILYGRSAQQIAAQGQRGQ